MSLGNCLQNRPLPRPRPTSQTPPSRPIRQQPDRGYLLSIKRAAVQISLRRNDPTPNGLPAHCERWPQRSLNRDRSHVLLTRRGSPASSPASHPARSVLLRAASHDNPAGLLDAQAHRASSRAIDRTGPTDTAGLSFQTRRKIVARNPCTEITNAPLRRPAPRAVPQSPGTPSRTPSPARPTASHHSWTSARESLLLDPHVFTAPRPGSRLLEHPARRGRALPDPRHQHPAYGPTSDPTTRAEPRRSRSPGRRPVPHRI